MGVDTKALLRGKIDVVQIANDLVELYGTNRPDIAIQFTYSSEMYMITFYQKNMPNFGIDFDARATWRTINGRSMCVFYDCKGDYANVTDEDCTYLTLGCWGESVEIMEILLRKYGGWIMRNDSTDDWEKFDAL